MKDISLSLSIIGFVGMIVISIVAIVDSNAEDMVSVVIVQLLFVAMFISGYISYSRDNK